MAKPKPKPKLKEEPPPVPTVEPPPTLALVARQPVEPVVRVLMRSDQMELAIREYRDLQKTLDRAMPEAIITIQGKPYRTKAYWRAIRTAFGLSIECITDPDKERITIDGDWGYRVTYLATSPSGNSAPGDGACMHSEKSRGRLVASEHNVRTHAHTRAFNRAVSNLVGFGEVSAEEVDRHEDDDPDLSHAFISEPQAKRLWAIAKAKGVDERSLRSIVVRDPWNYTSLKEIKKTDYEAIVKAVEEFVQ